MKKILITFFLVLCLSGLSNSSASCGLVSKKSKTISTIAGNLEIEKRKNINVLKLNGKIIHRISTHGKSLGLDKRLRIKDNEILVMSYFESGGSASEGSNVHIAIILNQNCEYQISDDKYTESYKTLRKVSYEDMKLKLDGEVVKIIGRGKASKDSFYAFFEKFRSNETFELSRTKFPLKYNKNPVEYIKKGKWSGLGFSSEIGNPEFSIKSKNYVVVQHNFGDPVSTTLHFKKMNNKWYLVWLEFYYC